MVTSSSLLRTAVSHPTIIHISVTISFICAIRALIPRSSFFISNFRRKFWRFIRSHAIYGGRFFHSHINCSKNNAGAAINEPSETFMHKHHEKTSKSRRKTFVVSIVVRSFVRYLQRIVLQRRKLLAWQRIKNQGFYFIYGLKQFVTMYLLFKRFKK